ncbi:Heterokaryon incompatibility protein (HET) [Ilyonectria robusta]
MAFTFSSNSALIASAAADVRLWRVDNGECLLILPGHATSVAISPDATLIPSASSELRIWRVGSGECIHEIRFDTTCKASSWNGQQRLEQRWVESIAFLLDSTLLAITLSDGGIQVWQITSGKRLDDESLRKLKSHATWAPSIAISSNHAITTSASGAIQLRHINGEFISEFEDRQTPMTSVAISPDSKLVATSSYDKTTRIWHVDTGECISQLRGHTEALASAAFSPDSKLVATVALDKTVRIWSVENIYHQQSSKGHAHQVEAVTLAPNRDLVASGSRRLTVRIWSIHSGQCIRELRGYPGWPSLLKFSPDSKLVAAVSQMNTATIWRESTSELILELRAQERSVRSVAISPDSKIMAVHIDGHDVRLWEIQSGDPTTDPNESRHLECDWPYYGLAIANNGTWITWKNRKLLWLPVPFRPHCSNIFGSSIAIGCTSGRVVFFTLKASELMKLENFSEPLVLDNPVLGWRRSREGRPVPAP